MAKMPSYLEKSIEPNPCKTYKSKQTCEKYIREDIDTMRCYHFAKLKKFIKGK